MSVQLPRNVRQRMNNCTRTFAILSVASMSERAVRRGTVRRLRSTYLVTELSRPSPASASPGEEASEDARKAAPGRDGRRSLSREDRTGRGGVLCVVDRVVFASLYALLELVSHVQIGTRYLAPEPAAPGYLQTPGATHVTSNSFFLRPGWFRRIKGR